MFGEKRESSSEKRGIKSRVVFLALTFSLVFSLFAPESGAGEERWRVLTQGGNNILSGVEYEIDHDDFVHYFFLSLIPSEMDETKIVFSIRLKVDMLASKHTEGAVAFTVDAGQHIVANYRSKPMADHKEYVSCVQVVEGVVFNSALLERLRAIIVSMESRPVDRKNPKHIAALLGDRNFQDLQAEVLNQMKKLRPVAEKIYHSFAFSTCEEGDYLEQLLRESTLMDDPSLEVAELREYSDDTDYVNPYYMNDYIAQIVPKMKDKEHTFELDLMDMALIFDSMTNEVTHADMETIVWADSRRQMIAKADVFRVNISIPLITWFMDIENRYSVNSGTNGPELMLIDYLGPDDTRLISWPLNTN